MKIFDTKEIRDIDAYTIRNEPIESVDLMERAAKGCAQWIADNISRESSIIIFTGPGNNGGDGWAIARLLAEKHQFRKLQLYHLQISKIISPDSETNRKRLIRQSLVPVKYIEHKEDFPLPAKTDIIVDALFGSGLSRSLEGLSLDLVKHLNQSGCKIISVDIPSGLFGEDNSLNPTEGIIKASHTLTFQFPKRSFFFSENEKFTGSWHIIPIGLHPDVMREKHTDYYYITPDIIRPMLARRKKFSHKGSHGHALLIAGSFGMMGAAILAARACIRTGTGLLTTHVPQQGYPIIQTSVPESVFSMDSSEKVFSKCPALDGYSAAGIGPGIGRKSETAEALKTFLENCKCPMVLDADALNLLAENRKLLDLLQTDTIITPHPGEFDRLAGISNSGFDRHRKQISLSKEHKLIIVLKGAYTSVTMPDGRCYFNSTGNPGMATAGSGDVLTGIILSLLAQGYDSDKAAVAGVFLHGMAGDSAVSVQSQESLIASDIIENIGNAFNNIWSHETSDN